MRNESEAAGARPPIEIGWLVVGRLDEPDEAAVERARAALREQLDARLAEFDWQMPLLRREAFTQVRQEEPVRLLDLGALERDVRHWDFCVLVTPADLVSYEKETAFAVTSSALGQVVISTARIDPHMDDIRASHEERVALMARRLQIIVLHGLGHLVGLPHEDAPGSCMTPFRTLDEIDRSDMPDAGGLRAALGQLHAIADARLEERPELRDSPGWAFFLRALVHNRRDVLRAAWDASPWLFPLRLSRLATAAVSALVVLLMSAESWELGMSLPLAKSFGLALVSLAVTAAYVVKRQRLLMRRYRPGAREQRVIASASIVLVVIVGMLVSFVCLLLLSFGAMLLFFEPEVVRSWAGANEDIGGEQYLSLGVYLSSLGLLIGALGASFENQLYFRHVTFVDEEI